MPAIALLWRRPFTKIKAMGHADIKSTVIYLSRGNRNS
jgi:hypothetical protein